MRIRAFGRYFLIPTAVSLLAVVHGHATTLFNDGGVHNLTTPQDDVVISNGTTVNFLAGSSATGATDGTGAGGNGVRATESSAVSIDGGTVIGGTTTKSAGTGGLAIYVKVGSLSISAGSVTGGTKTGGSGGGGLGLLLDEVTLTMTGGTVRGGFKGTGSGSGGDAITLLNGSLTLSGGSVIGGNADSFFGGRVLVFSNVTGAIAGGSFTVGQGTASSTGLALIEASGGTLDISGGAFQSNRNWVLSNGAVFNVFGTGLTKTGTSSGTLTGTLQDGNAINIKYSLSGGSVININPVPPNAPVQRFCDAVCPPSP